MVLQQIIDIIESVAPLSCQEQWDNSGLQVGDRTQDVGAVLLTTDVTEAVVGEAISLGCDLIVSHHPLLFHGLKQVTGATPQERCVAQALRHDIAIYSSHTALDSVADGVSGRMAAMLGLRDCHILAPTGENTGLGIIGQLPAAITTEELVEFVRHVFDTPYIHYTRARHPIRTLAVCGGAGAEFTETAIAQGADAYLTADVKYHEFQAADGRIALLAIDHWVSEQHVRELFREMLQDHVTCHIATSDCSPVHTMV